jgi:soluble lytic murein transglycosylase
MPVDPLDRQPGGHALLSTMASEEEQLMIRCKGTHLAQESILTSMRRKAAHRSPSRRTWGAQWRLVILLSPWLCALVGWFDLVAPAGATAKSRGRPPHQAPAPKGPPAPERSYEQRLQQALALMQRQQWPQAVQRIGPLDEAAPMTPPVGRLWFLRARLAQHLQDAPTARQAFTQVWRTYPPLADYAAWELAQDDAAHDRLPALQETVMAMAEHYAFSRLVPDGQLLLARTQHRLGRVPQAQATLEHLLETHAEAPIRPEALAFLGQISEETGDLRRAFQTLQHLGESFPRHPGAAEALEHSRQILARLPAEERSPPEPGPLLASIDALAEAQLWQEVEARLATLSALTEPPSLVLKVLLKRAGVAIRRQHLADASAMLQEIQRRFPQGTHLAEVQNLLTIVRRRQGQRASLAEPAARRLSEPLLLSWLPNPLVTLASLPSGGQQVARRTEAFSQRLVQEVTPAEALGQSLWQAGWESYRQAQYAAAARVWSEIETRFPGAALLPQVLYWQARIAILKGHLDPAKRLYQRLINDYPTHYYRQLAAIGLEKLIHSSQNSDMVLTEVDATPPTVPWTPPRPLRALDPSPGPPTKARFHFIRVQELQRLQMHPLAAREIQMLAPLLPNTMSVRYVLATLFADSEEHAAALRLLNGLIEAMSPAEIRGLSRTVWTLLFPRAFWPEVRQQSERLGLNPYVVLSMMRQESAFDPMAVSTAGARGLLQLMPATAQDVAARLSQFDIGHEQLHDPPLSIALGTHYLAELLERYQGQMVLALAAYNAGPGRVDRWRDQWPDLAMEEFVEHIPFDETRAYVKLVLRNLAVYEWLYPAS